MENRIAEINREIESLKKEKAHIQSKCDHEFDVSDDDWDGTERRCQKCFYVQYGAMNNGGRA